MNTTEELNNAHDPQTGPEQGLRSGSAAGDSHGETTDAPDDKEEEASADTQTPGERRKELLKED